MIVANFDQLKFENIEGYRISCRLTPSRGFDGHFFVYIDERRQALTPFAEQAKVSKAEQQSIKPVRGTLQLKEADRVYDFQNIDLAYAELGATRRERTRYFEFRYDPAITDVRNANPITIKGKKKDALKPSELGSDYMGGTDENRHLLGFRAFVSASAGTVVRLSNLGALPKSFLEKVVDLNKQMQAAAGDKVLPEFTVKFSQGDFAVTPDNLIALFVEESWGSLAHHPTPPVHRLLETNRPDVERLRPREYTGYTLLEHDTSREFRSQNVEPGTVELATLVFRQGYFHELSVR